MVPTQCVSAINGRFGWEMARVNPETMREKLHLYFFFHHLAVVDALLRLACTTNTCVNTHGRNKRKHTAAVFIHTKSHMQKKKTDFHVQCSARYSLLIQSCVRETKTIFVSSYFWSLDIIIKIVWQKKHILGLEKSSTL